MKRLAAIGATVVAFFAVAFEGVDSMHTRIARESRESVCECFKASGLNPYCQPLESVPVKWTGFFVQCGEDRSTACYDSRARRITIAAMSGEIGSAFWRSTDSLAKSLRHEYVHALADVSGFPPINNNDKIMRECEDGRR